MKLELECPECGRMVKVEYDPGEKPITSGPPDRWYPGYPEIAEVLSGCNCAESMNFKRREIYEESLLNAVREELQAQEDSYWDHRLDEMREDGLA